MDVVSGESRDGWRLLFHPTDAQLLSKVPHTMHCISYIIILYFPFPTSLYFLHHWIVFPNLVICFKRLSTSLCFLEYSTIFCLESQAILFTNFAPELGFPKLCCLMHFMKGIFNKRRLFQFNANVCSWTNVHYDIFCHIYSYKEAKKSKLNLKNQTRSSLSLMQRKPHRGMSHRCTPTPYEGWPRLPYKGGKWSLHLSYYYQIWGPHLQQ